MALLTSPPSKPKAHIFVPLSRSSHQHRGNVASLRPVPQLSIFPKFGTINESKPEKLLRNTKLLRNFHVNNDRRIPVSNAAFTEGAEPANGKRIILSDVVVKRPRRVFSGRKWNSMDMSTAGVVLAMHLLSLFAPFHCNWAAFWVAIALYIVTGLFGITLSFHRNLSHRSFKLPKSLEYLFAYCGALALQGNPIDWVSTHRYHHQFCDSERDPHSPTEGFWFSHMSWLFDTNSVAQRCGGPTNVSELEKQTFYKFLQSTYIVHPIALGTLLYAFGGFPFLVWGMGVRVIWVYHITWLVNSACHVWGMQAWKTGDLSRNNWWVALLAFGEGWHNNHHAFEYSARHGLEWWQLDMTWYVVRLLQALGLATEVKLPTETQKQRMALNN
ncbi:palmitoyl-monogalactosyldiacylglycerol delta-7 desaturase, chloroplastic-like [Humulus lupulus]|uniref:palmitoyl-monogalactosyldiacylglycerol delta-7 desaturase, chloroplastic-like n=1 Tax=Humulus lupulus TaxID=3486 RepID=UPI002B41198E|nr:palmitoyl-monogalactosyldiacylglycerol delta-7 desaturase, chloroplastic-like [Humulus lupulus]